MLPLISSTNSISEVLLGHVTSQCKLNLKNFLKAKILTRKIQNQPQGTVIRTENVIFNKGIFDPPLFQDVPGHKKVIDAPSRSVFSGIEPVTPPRVLDGIRIQVAEGVYIPVFDDFIQTVPFDPEKTGTFGIGTGVFQVDFVVGGVEIACDHQAPALIF
jgi:hypothetical protein